MVRRHKAYQEPDVEASQALNDADYYAGENPEKPGSARWMAWENRKRQDAGLPASNDPTGPETVVMINKNAAFQEVDYKASKSSSGGR
jgi:hypothetical protein